MIHPDIPDKAISVMNPWCGWLALGYRLVLEKIETNEVP